MISADCHPAIVNPASMRTACLSTINYWLRLRHMYDDARESLCFYPARGLLFFLVADSDFCGSQFQI